MRVIKIKKSEPLIDKNGKEIYQGNFVRITLKNKTDVYAICRIDGFYYAVQNSAKKVVIKRITFSEIQKKRFEYVFVG